MRTAKACHGPVAVMGDFNTPPRGQVYSVAVSGLSDCFTSAGWGTGCTFPCRLPMWRIDYVLANDDVRVKSCRVPQSLGSNHRPIVADLVLRARIGGESR